MKVDVVIIGAGPGGYVCAIRLAQYGKKVIVIERDKLGGECLNYGCIPSKALIFASSLYERVRTGGEFGIEVSKARMNMNKLQGFRKNLISKLNHGIEFLLQQNKVEVVSGEASFIDPHRISVTSKHKVQTIEADHFVIATGSKPIQIPGFECDGTSVIGSKEALELKKIPKHLVILGGGVIGLELGTYFAKLGSKISVIEMMPQLLPGIDLDLVSVVEKALKKRGGDIYVNAKAKSLKRLSQRGGKRQKGKAVSLTIEAGGLPTVGGKEKVITGDKLLITIGRRANTEGLNLSAIGVLMNERGFIGVNDNLETSVSHIYAIGDVIGPPLLAHKASHEGLHVADAIVFRAHRVEKALSWAIFTDPEIAGVGVTREQAKAKGIEVVVGKFPFVALGRALATSESEGFIKVIADKKTEEIKGVFMVGAHASDLISEAALAVTKKLNLHDIIHTIHPHPTFPESFVEASEAAMGKAIHIFNRNPRVGK